MSDNPQPWTKKAWQALLPVTAAVVALLVVYGLLSCRRR